MKYIVLLSSKRQVMSFLFSIIVVNSFAQISFLGGLNIGGQIGFSRINTELLKDFSETINEFDNKAGLAFNAEFSKYVYPQWEIGTSINYSNLSGENFSPSFSAEEYHAVFIGNSITKPVEYSNRLLGQKFFLRYYFRNISRRNWKFSFNPYLTSGVGYINYKSKFNFIDTPDDIIFGKGTGDYPLELTTDVFYLGAGFKTYLSPRLNMITSFNINSVNYDFLDVVHNYDQNGNRLKIWGIYSELKIGIVFSLTSFKAGKGRNRKNSIQEYNPFTPTR